MITKITYRTVKTLVVKKFGEKGYCNALAEKTLVKKHVSFDSFLCNQLEISAALPFRQVSKRIANETEFSLSRKHRCIDSMLSLVGWLSQG